MNLVWSPAAVEDLSSAVDYIEYDLDSPQAAKRFYDAVIERVRLFADVPGSGITLRTISGVDTGYRYTLCGSWMIFFSCETDQTIVIRILYGRSDYVRTLFGDID